MQIEEKLRVLAAIFSCSMKERAMYLAGFQKRTPLAYDPDGSSTENVLFFLCVHYLDVIDTCNGSEDVGQDTSYRELMAVLNVFFNLPERENYVWNYAKESSEGVFDDLWIVVARLSRAIISHHRAVPSELFMDVNVLVDELLK